MSEGKRWPPQAEETFWVGKHHGDTKGMVLKWMPSPWAGRRYVHTAGPWRVVGGWPRTDVGGAEIAGGERGTICHVVGDSFLDEDDAEAASNLRLIVAAPEMYEALLAARNELSEFMPTTAGATLTKIEAAIARARGEEGGGER